ncbi:MAG: nitroreductase [Rhodospirillales bacterium]|nr:nitroreductase [Rhodospirillales bacterium]
MNDAQQDMTALEALATRASATKLSAPGPSAAIIAKALQAATRAPDHGMLRPWKFLLIEGDARLRLGQLMAETLKRREPHVSADVMRRESEKPLRSPLIIVVAAKVQPDHPKIPEIEQVASAAAATQNIMLAFHAAGFGTMWKTGQAAYDSTVKAALGLAPHDHIVGLVYVGTTVETTGETRRPDHSDFVEAWNGPRA